MTTVLALYRPDDLAEHHEALNDWLIANGVDPCHVALRGISVEEQDGQRLIRYWSFARSLDGRPLADPDDPNRAWTKERTVTLVTDLPDVPSHGVTGQPARGGG